MFIFLWNKFRYFFRVRGSDLFFYNKFRYFIYSVDISVGCYSQWTVHAQCSLSVNGLEFLRFICIGSGNIHQKCFCDLKSIRQINSFRSAVAHTYHFCSKSLNYKKNMIIIFFKNIFVKPNHNVHWQNTACTRHPTTTHATLYSHTSRKFQPANGLLV